MYLKKYKDEVNYHINIFLDSILNDDLRNMVSYSLEGGKRLRSVICLYLFKKFGIKK